MAVRQVSNRGGNIIGHFPSVKMKRMIAFESLIELDYLYLVDYEQAVDQITEQPLTLEYRVDDKTLHYTPDFLVVRATRHTLVECKPQTLVDLPENRRKFNAARAECAERGWDFEIATDQHIRTGFRLGNVKTLTRAARRNVTPVIRGGVFAILQAASALSIDELSVRIRIAHPTFVLTDLYHLAFHHEIFVDVDAAPLSGKSAVRWPTPPAISHLTQEA